MVNNGRRRTYISPLRARRTALLRQRIMAEAAEQLASQGYFGARMRDIADAVGCSMESVYGLVGPKSEVVLQVYLAQVSPLMAPLEQVPPLGPIPGLGGVADLQEAVSSVVDLLAPWTPLTAGIWVAAVEAGPEVSELHRRVGSVTGLRRSACASVAGELVPGAAREDVAASLYVMTSAETHLMLTRDVTLSESACRAWVVKASMGAVVGAR